MRNENAVAETVVLDIPAATANEEQAAVKATASTKTKHRSWRRVMIYTGIALGACTVAALLVVKQRRAAMAVAAAAAAEAGTAAVS